MTRANPDLGSSDSAEKEGETIVEKPSDPGVAFGMGAIAALTAERHAELRFERQGIRTCGVEYACGPARVPTAMTVCVPKEMPPAEIEEKINAENLTGVGPWWKASPEKTCPCNHQPERLHYAK
jgi:hypothetical protein